MDGESKTKTRCWEKLIDQLDPLRSVNVIDSTIDTRLLNFTLRKEIYGKRTARSY